MLDDATRARLEALTPHGPSGHDVAAMLAAYDAQAARLAAVEKRLHPCHNCGQLTSRSLCERCRSYQRRTGRPRPVVTESLIADWLPRAGLMCPICRQRPVWARGRCGRCYQYWHRTGREWRAVLAGAAGEGRDE